MLFRDADIETSFGHLLHHDIQGASGGHRRGDADNLGIALRQFQNGVSEDVLKLGGMRAWSLLEQLARVRIVFAGSMPNGLIGFRLLESFALDGDAV